MVDWNLGLTKRKKISIYLDGLSFSILVGIKNKPFHKSFIIYIVLYQDIKLEYFPSHIVNAKNVNLVTFSIQPAQNWW